MKFDRIHQVAIYARDLDEAVSFYRDILGAAYVAKFDPPGLVFFDIAGTRLLLEKTGPKATIYLRVDDIESAYAELIERGVRFIGEPHVIFRDDSGTFGKAGEEEWMAFFHDPSENMLAIASRKSAQSSSVKKKE